MHIRGWEISVHPIHGSLLMSVHSQRWYEELSPSICGWDGAMLWQSSFFVE